MATPRQKKIALSAVVAIGAAALFFQTFPHLKPSFLQGQKSSNNSNTSTSSEPMSKSIKEQEEDLISSSTVLVNNKDKKVEDWSLEDLTAFLKERQVSVPEGATSEELVALVNSLLKK
ncbi:unnamed protein product [Ambrosiozyma monospora]|uniref:Unnamed protein product n=1 Tax=Ambrosiozyma monospora TaxID=43982 RepID=A0ACB5TGG5_AMBMO|nr:unnamed protein product [Ambrosiozyma monospora]